MDLAQQQAQRRQWWAPQRSHRIIEWTGNTERWHHAEPARITSVSLSISVSLSLSLSVPLTHYLHLFSRRFFHEAMSNQIGKPCFNGCEVQYVLLQYSVMRPFNSNESKSMTPANRSSIDTKKVLFFPSKKSVYLFRCAISQLLLSFWMGTSVQEPSFLVCYFCTR